MSGAYHKKCSVCDKTINDNTRYSVNLILKKNNLKKEKDKEKELSISTFLCYKCALELYNRMNNVSQDKDYILTEEDKAICDGAISLMKNKTR